MLKVLRQAKDKDLTREQLAEREVRRRRHEIDAQIVNALEKGNSVGLLLTHPAGLLGKGTCRFLRHDRGAEIIYIKNRYRELQARFDSGTEFQDLDAAIAAEIRAGKRKGDRRVDDLSAIKVRGVMSKRGKNGKQLQRFARARALKDHSEYEYQEWALSVGAMYELSQQELVLAHDSNVAECMVQINNERAQLGLPALKLVEE